MIIRGASLVSRLAVFFAVSFFITACGGGGGGSSFFDDGSNSSDRQFSFTLLDAEGNETNTITRSSTGTLRVKLRRGGANVVVTAETDLATLFPESGTALTDGSGTATFQLVAGDAKGGGTLLASAEVDGETVTGTFAYQVGESGLRLGYFDTDGMFVENRILIEPASTLAAGGNAQLSVVILDSSGNRVTTVETVRFTSGCVAGEQATMVPLEPQSVNGEASTLYTARGCTGTDQVTASLVGATAQAFADLSVAARETNTVNFVSASPTLIVLRGTGGENRDETSDVVFRVVDGAGIPLQGVSVEFSLTTFVGGLELSNTSSLSDGNGEVRVTVQAGDVATTVRVIATVDDGDGDPVSTVSDLLTVTTGLPDQNSIDIAIADSWVVGGAFNTLGLTRLVTVAMSDKFNNPVVDGTAAIFTTEYGSIESSCFTVDGACSVTWSSQDPHVPTLTGFQYVVSDFDNQGVNCPDHNASNAIPCPRDLGFIRGGRSTISVTAIGEESFIDRNGNGIMDEDERLLFENIPEAFIDHNEDGVYTPADSECLNNGNSSLRCIAGQEELFTDFNSNEIYDFNDDPPLYNGLLCPPEGDGVWCSRKLINVRASHVITMGDGPNYNRLYVTPAGIVVDQFVHQGSYTIFVADTFNNPPPAGSTVSVSGNGGCEVFGAESSDVFNYPTSGAYVYPGFTIGNEPSEQPLEDFVEITIDTPTVTITEKVLCTGGVPEGEGGDSDQNFGL